jgi:hypothetical protein
MNSPVCLTSWPSLRHNPDSSLEVLRKTMENLSIAGHRVEIFNPEPPEYEAGVLTSRPRRSEVHSVISAYMLNVSLYYHCPKRQWNQVKMREAHVYGVRLCLSFAATNGPIAYPADDT